MRLLIGRPARAGLLVALLFELLAPGSSRAASIQGQGRLQRIKGNPNAGYRGLYEWDLFLSMDGGGVVGSSRRLGAPPGEPITGDGFFSVQNLPPGAYSILIDQPDFYARPKVVSGVALADGQPVTQNVDLAVDYSTYFPLSDGGTWGDWGTPWYQTFVATGLSITGVAFQYAGAGNDNRIDVAVTVLEDNGDPDVRSWTPVATRTVDSNRNTDNWVRWRSGEVPTTAGARYAIQLAGSDSFAPFLRADDADSYPDGTAYDSAGNARDFDLCVVVFSDNDGTIVPYAKRDHGIGLTLNVDPAGTWGQTFVATGSGLAGADVFGFGNTGWDVDTTWRLREDGPDGPEIAPSKTTKAAYFAGGSGLYGVSYSRGEVSLVRGRTYYLEVSFQVGAQPYFLDLSDAYDLGDAYREGVLISDGGPRDLSMSIIEYVEDDFSWDGPAVEDAGAPGGDGGLDGGNPEEDGGEDGGLPGKEDAGIFSGDAGDAPVDAGPMERGGGDVGEGGATGGCSCRGSAGSRGAGSGLLLGLLLSTSCWRRARKLRLGPNRKGLSTKGE